MAEILIAITRAISPAIARCELTHLSRQPIDLDLAKAQHREYERRLADAGCSTLRLETSENMPDSVFVEDTAVVFDELAIITRPGAASRRGETTAVAEALRSRRALHFIEPPGCLDGGDVLVVGKRVFIGVSGRTNEEAVVQMQRILNRFGYAVEAVHVHGCLHLKSAVTLVAHDTVLLNRAFVAAQPFRRLGVIDVDAREARGANALKVGNHVIYSTAFPRTYERLEQHGLVVHGADVSELMKAEGAVTCCSLILTV